MTNDVIAVIGTGNMGSSLIRGLISYGYPAKNIWASDADPAKLLALQENLGIKTTTHNEEAVQKATLVIFALKPQLLADVALKLAPHVQQQQPLIISIAAGIRLSSLQNWLGEKLAIVRCMPNTPAMVSCGATALFGNSHVSAAQHQSAESIMRSVGIVVWLTQEEQMDIVTALSGSGPAYFFLFMEILEETAIELGLPADISHLLTLQTALGAARMALENNISCRELRHQVTSPGGTTEKALAVLEKNHLRATVKEALHAAKKRAEELAGIIRIP